MLKMFFGLYYIIQNFGYEPLYSELLIRIFLANTQKKENSLILVIFALLEDQLKLRCWYLLF